MDRYILNLVTLSSHDIKAKIDSIKDIDRLTTVCEAGDINKPDTYNTADVVFLSYSQAVNNIKIVEDNKAEYTSIILLSDDEVSSTPNPDLLKYDLWNAEGISFLHHISAFKEHMRNKLDLELRSNQHTTLIDSLPDLIWYKDLQGLHIDVNDAFCKSVDRTKDEIMYRDQGFIMGLTPEEFAKGDFACVTTDNLVIKEQTTHLFDEKVLIHDEMRQFKTYKTAIRGRKGESIGTVGLAHDVTDIWNTHEEFRIVISRLPYPMFILDKNYAMLSYNSKFEELFDYHDENVARFDVSAFGEKYFEFDIASKQDNNISVEKKTILKGETTHFVIEKSEITDVFGELSGFFYIFRDVTKNRKYEEKLRMMAETDELTQINNRKAIRDFYETRLHSLVRKQLSFAVAIIDIDYFKLYNDHYGHLEGDIVIKALANILKGRSDNEKIFVARFGGEEFLVLAIDKTPDEVKTLINDLINDLKQEQIPHEKSQVSDILSMSIGVNYLDKLDPSMKLVDLIEIADKYLYQAKENGRNRYISNI